MRQALWILDHLTGHHPRCVGYKNDTLNIGPIRLCKGCSIGYPSIAMGIFLSSKYPQEIASSLTLIIVLTAVSLALEVSKRWFHPLKTVARIILGHGLGHVMYQLVKVDNWWFRIFLVAFMLSMGTTVTYLRYNSITETCNAHCGSVDANTCGVLEFSSFEDRSIREWLPLYPDDPDRHDFLQRKYERMCAKIAQKNDNN